MIEVRDFSTLSPTNTAAWREIFGQALTEYYPSGDFRRGSLQFFVVRPTAAVAEALAETGRRLLASDSLAAIDADPTLADPAIVDKYLSRWGLTRQEGSRSAGPVLIVLETALPIVISAGAIFRTGGLAFAATGVFAARAEEANVIGPHRPIAAAPRRRHVRIHDRR
jgi:hypothetical protein